MIKPSSPEDYKFFEGKDSRKSDFIQLSDPDVRVDIVKNLPLTNMTINCLSEL